MLGDPMVPYLIRHGLAGTLAGCMAAALLLTWQVAGVGGLVPSPDLFPVPRVVLFASFGLVFAVVALGAALMGLGGIGPRAPSATPAAAPPDRQSAPLAATPPVARQR